MTNVAQKLEALEAILTTEQRALLQGDVTELVELEPEKLMLLEALNDSDLQESDTIEKLRMIALRNQELMESVHAGVRAAKDRFDALVLAQKPMSAYGPSGKMSPLNVLPTPSVEKRT
ncbi:hypothetical protein [Algirhabdus cladophorae]|uniref:hypothetical protein n=1 Tax=Algirhabdus cladophorae TaxID=3377108 RepID=UPI003B84A49E